MDLVLWQVTNRFRVYCCCVLRSAAAAEALASSTLSSTLLSSTPSQSQDKVDKIKTIKTEIQFATINSIRFSHAHRRKKATDNEENVVVLRCTKNSIQSNQCRNWWRIMKRPINYSVHIQTHTLYINKTFFIKNRVF